MTTYLNETFDLSDPNLVSVLDEFPLWSSYFGTRLLDIINYKRNLTALDIGCGTGFPLIELAQRLGLSSTVFGVDPWIAAYERISLKLKTMKVNNVIYLNQSAEQLPFEDNLFDLAVSNNGINNVQHPDKVLSECYRVMKTGGQFALTMNLPGTMIEFYNIFRVILSAKELTGELKAIDRHIHSKRKSVNENLTMLTSAGFKIDEVSEDNFYMRYADGTSFLNHFFIKLAFLESWRNIPPADRIEEIFAELEEALNLYSEKEGHLKLSIPFVIFKCHK
jgi:arsenite methyltransferase